MSMKYQDQSMVDVAQSFYQLVIKRNNEINGLYKILKDHNLDQVLHEHLETQKLLDQSDKNLELFKKYRLDSFVQKTPFEVNSIKQNRKREKILNFWKSWDEFMSLSILGKIGLILLYILLVATLLAFGIALLLLAFRIIFGIKTGNWN